MAYEILANGEPTGIIVNDDGTVTHKDGTPVQTIDQITY